LASEESVKISYKERDPLSHTETGKLGTGGRKTLGKKGRGGSSSHVFLSKDCRNRKRKRKQSPGPWGKSHDSTKVGFREGFDFGSIKVPHRYPEANGEGEKTGKASHCNLNTT